MVPIEIAADIYVKDTNGMNESRQTPDCLATLRTALTSVPKQTTAVFLHNSQGGVPLVVVPARIFNDLELMPLRDALSPCLSPAVDHAVYSVANPNRLRLETARSASHHFPDERRPLPEIHGRLISGGQQNLQVPHRVPAGRR